MIITQVAGRLGRDPETRFTPSGQKVTNLTVATNVRKGGKDETVWWRVTVWGDRFDKMITYLKKGSAVIVIGEMGKPDIWTDKEGKPQVSLELTADIIRFSPFGNPDSKADQSQQGASGNNEDGGHSDFGGNASGYTPPQGSSAQYGANQGGASQSSSSYGTSSKYNQSIPHNEEQLPF